MWDDRSLLVLFVTYEDHQKMIKPFYRFNTKTAEIQKVKLDCLLNASMSEATLPYSWGNASRGKLGIGLSTTRECENSSEM
jgi:hypothetical protein